ncbi:hypothetical protein K8I31_13115 [bacterium]|nr:hypothetical protein [bacterium]
MSITIRPYNPADRETVRRICCDTGFSGSAVDPLFCDRDVFADYLTRYYTDWEPESAFIAEDNGEVVGYILGSVRPRRHEWAQAWILCAQVAPKALLRLMTGRYNKASRNFLWWCMTQGPKQTPAAPKESGHLHFNLLPDYRAQGGAGGIGARLLIPHSLNGRNKAGSNESTAKSRQPMTAAPNGCLISSVFRRTIKKRSPNFALFTTTACMCRLWCGSSNDPARTKVSLRGFVS